MINNLGSVLLFLVVLSLTIIEKKRINSIITPFTVTAWPFAFISIFVNFFLVHFQFYPVTLRVNLLLLSILILIWITGLVLSVYFNKTKINCDDILNKFSQEYAKYDIIIIIVSIIIIIVTFLKVYLLIKSHGGWWFYADPKFEKTMIIGPIAHLIQLAKVNFILLLIIIKGSKRKILITLTLSGLFFTIAVSGVKYHLIMVILISFFFYTSGKRPNVQLKKVILICTIILITMNLFWISLFYTWNTFSMSDSRIWDYLFRYSFNYLTSGPIAFDQWLNYNSVKPDWTLLVVFKNIINVLLNDPDRISTVSFVNVGFKNITPMISSNVGTSFGVYFLIGGYPFVYFMSLMTGFLSYIFYFLYKQTASIVILYLSCLFLTLGFLSFFVQYYTLLSIYEITVLFFITILILNILNKTIYQTFACTKKL